MRALVLSLALAAAIGAAIPASAAEPDRVVICHQPAYTTRQQTMTIPVPALRGHLKHGDALGPCGASNQPPVADAGADQTAPVGTTVSLDGSASTDGDGDALKFLWSFQSVPAGSGAALSDPSAINPTFVIDEPGTYLVQLVVHDGEASSAPDTVQVSTVNSPPVADAGEDQTVFVAQTATLDGSGSSDVDGDALTFQWQFVSRPDGSTATLSDPTAATPSFVADLPGLYLVELVVHDGFAASAPDAVTVSTENSAPVADAGPNQSATAGDLVQLDGSGSSDPDGTPLDFSWSLTTRPAGSAAALADPLAVAPTFVTDLPGIYVAQLIVSDGVLFSAPDTTTVTAVEETIVSVVATDRDADEAGLDPGTFAISRLGPTESAITVFYTIAGTAAPGTDYDALPGAVTIAAGDGSADVVVAPIDDALFEGPETVVLTLSADPNYTVGALDSATVTIADDERPVVTIVAPDEQAAEAGLDPGTFTVSRTGPTTDALVVALSIGGSAANGIDYETIASQVTILPGDASAMITLTPVDDSLVEGAEIAAISVAADPAYTVGSPNLATVTIADDDVPVVTVVAADPDATEAGPTPGAFTFTRTGDAAEPLLVHFTRSGTATGGNVGQLDYEPIGTLVTIPAGASSVDVVLLPRQDNLVEEPETATLTIDPSGDYVVGTPDSATVTIADDPPVVSVTATDPEAAEAGPDPGVFMFVRTGGDLASSLAIRTSFGGTAGNSSDFVFISGLVTVAANETEATLTIVPLADNRVEGDETMVVTIIPQAGVDLYVIGSPSSATVTIADDPAVVRVTATDPAASEVGLDPGEFTFTRAGGNLDEALPVLVGRSGTASNGGDFESIGSNFLVTLPAGATSTTLAITPRADNLVEPAETVVLTIQPRDAYAIGDPSAATVTIADDPPVVTVDATDPDASESGPDPGAFTFTRSGGNLAAALTVSFARAGSATNSSDYANLGFSVSIAAGESSAVVTVHPIDDAAVEGPETVELTVNATANHLPGAPATATVTIADDD